MTKINTLREYPRPGVTSRKIHMNSRRLGGLPKSAHGMAKLFCAVATLSVVMGAIPATAQLLEEAAFEEAVEAYDNYSDAFRQLSEDAKKGDTPAQYFVGVLYHNGLGVPQNYGDTVKWYRMAAEKGHGLAQYNLGFMYENGFGVDQDHEEAVRWYRMAAEQGYASSQGSLGLMYKNGSGVDQDHEEAVRWFRMAAEQGHAPSQGSLGLMYENGFGVDQDHEEAVRWFRMAAEQGHAPSQGSLGFMYENGFGVDQDHEEAVRWYRMAAEQGSDLFLFSIGFMYLMGNGVDQDVVEAARWFRMAAERGNDLAQLSLGTMYENGLGVDQDHEEAARWYRIAADRVDDAKRALVSIIDDGNIPVNDDDMADLVRQLANQGYADAQFQFGVMYAKGLGGVPLDDAKAVEWYEKAAEQDHAYAQFRLGIMYAEGRGGVPLDDAKAVEWHRKSAEHGNAEAQIELSERYRQGRGVPQDFIAWAGWLEQAARQGSTKAQYILGGVYEWGKEGLPKDDAKAIEWYERAAEQEHADAQFRLGIMYAKGRGVAPDDAKAVEWYKEAAKQGHADAQYQLGIMHAEEGRGTLREDAKKAHDAKAVEWYERAAKQGHALAQLRLGEMLEAGRGYTKSLVQAHKWYNLAGSRLQEQAMETAVQKRERVASGLTKVHLVEAQRLAKLWKPILEENHLPPPNLTGSLNLGSGFWVNSEGYILTNDHVVRNEQGNNCDGKLHIQSGVVEVVASDREVDLALLRTSTPADEARVIAKFEIDQKILEGGRVMAMGYPLDAHFQVTEGVISAITVPGEPSHIQFDAALNFGNSGGPVVNAAGNVIGVAAKFKGDVFYYNYNKETGAILHKDYKPRQGLSYAVNLDTVRTFLDKYEISYETATDDNPMEAEEVVEMGREFTVRIECVELPALSGDS